MSKEVPVRAAVRCAAIVASSRVSRFCGSLDARWSQRTWPSTGALGGEIWYGLPDEPALGGLRLSGEPDIDTGMACLLLQGDSSSATSCDADFASNFMFPNLTRLPRCAQADHRVCALLW